jgi:hypothetical protein
LLPVTPDYFADACCRHAAALFSSYADADTLSFFFHAASSVFDIGFLFIYFQDYSQLFSLSSMMPPRRWVMHGFASS